MATEQETETRTATELKMSSAFEESLAALIDSFFTHMARGRAKKEEAFRAAHFAMSKQLGFLEDVYVEHMDKPESKEERVTLMTENRERAHKLGVWEHKEDHASGRAGH